ncbi:MULTISPECIES: hypothetical protein [Haloferax]|uniref:Uncharacterized protein n=2 Tax=Haloferax TaxID=2251 RepID=A0A6G1Z1T1_9EURY|nr:MULTISPECIES: hypothetical protein [Haloferax]KAB1187839.1 hypothetical protein Hfx1149_07250 [Haloferax sp. CBA1149]MRW80500.1 hypothetical protein [Haloferax marinisediminis]
MDSLEIEHTVQNIADAYDIEVYDVHESGNTLVIEQEEFEDTRSTMTSALLFDRYDAGFDHIEIHVPDSGETKRISRTLFQESLSELSNVIGNQGAFGSSF